MFTKGDRIEVLNDSILGGCMGIPVATGTIVFVNTDGKVIGFKCDQTGAIECIDDGTVSKL